MQNNVTESASVRAGHETSDAHALWIWITGLGLVICAVAVMLAVGLIFRILDGRHTEEDRIGAYANVAESVSASAEKFPGPRLQVKPEVDLATFRAGEDDQLDHYGWIDKKAGVVRLPIERAMDLLAQRGLAYRGRPGAPPPTTTVLDMQQARPSDWSKQQAK